MASVLVIEDSPTDAHVFRRALEKGGHQVDTATTGEAGIRQAIENRPDVILMDIVMPGVNGFQATRELQKIDATSSIPIVIVTTKDQETDRIWGLRQGASDYLVKPVKARILLSCVDNLLADAVDQ